MVKILYVDKELFNKDCFDRDSKLKKVSLNLIDKLRQKEFEVDVVDEFTLCDFDNFNLQDISVIKDFRIQLGWMLDNLKKYDFLISHIGVYSPKNFFNYVLPELPNLKIAFVSDACKDYDVKERMGVFDYESPKIFNFLSK